MGADTSVLGIPFQYEITGFVSRYRTAQGGDLRVDEAPAQTDLFLTVTVPLGF